MVVPLLASALQAQAPPPIIDVLVHAIPLTFFAALAGPAPVPHGVSMTDYPVPDSGTGLRPGDPPLAPLWALAEELDVPVGIHLGTGPVGAPCLAFPRYRAECHSALTIEEVLVCQPRARVFLMHAGGPMLDDLLAVLWT